jgi:hypothetical protein
LINRRTYKKVACQLIGFVLYLYGQQLAEKYLLAGKTRPELSNAANAQ